MNVLTSFIQKKYIILFFIVLIAAFLRFWNLASVPPSVSLDEASIGWNAYAVFKTGGDEYGKFPLISQRGYDDWRRSTYLLLTIPFIGLLGLSGFAERMPAVILSVITVFASYWITVLLFTKKSKYALGISFLVPILLAISPWHLYISRLGHESNACLSFLVIGMLFFLLGERKKNFPLLLIALISFTLSMISYYSGQIVIPILLVGLSILYRTTLPGILFANYKRTIVLGIFSIFFVIILANVFSPASLIRFRGTSTFTPDSHRDLFNAMVTLRNNAVRSGNVIGEIMYNRRLYPVIVWVEGYISHFDPRWLFFNSDKDAFKIPNMGLLYLWELPFILLGAGVVIFTGELPIRSKLLIFLWFFLGPLPASVATQAPHAMRAYNFLPTWQIFTACGLVYMFYRIEKMKIVSLILFGILTLYSLTLLYKNYFLLFPLEESEPYQYAIRDAVWYTKSNQNSFKNIVISNQNNLYQSYMFYLFYTKYDPKKYQQEGGTISGGYNVTHAIDNVTFRPISWNKEESGALLVGNPSDFPIGTPSLFQSLYLDGTTGVVVKKK